MSTLVQTFHVKWLKMSISPPSVEQLQALGASAMIDVHHPIKVSASAWAQEHLVEESGRLQTRDEHCEFFVGGWKKCADRGVQGLLVSPSLGGVGADLVTALLTLEGIGHGNPDNGLTFALCSQLFTIQRTIQRFGSPAQQQQWLPKLVSGQAYGSFCMTEPESGSDAFSMSTAAVRDGDGYLLSGTKAHVTLGPIANVYLVFAVTNPAVGRWGLSAFLVPADSAGVRASANQPKMGVRTTPFGEVSFDNVRVSADQRVGPEGAGASMFSAILDEERAFLFVGQLGANQRVLEQTVARAKSRMQSGRPIGDYQAVSHRIATMKLQHETSRLLLYKCAMLAINGKPMTTEAALTKLHISEVAAESALSAVRVHGASGYLSETGVERELRDAVGGLVYSGTSDIQRNIVARLLGLGS
jgi:alkylation response protein AidB-like acyl-CoA dehydrogenase